MNKGTKRSLSPGLRNSIRACSVRLSGFTAGEMNCTRPPKRSWTSIVDDARLLLSVARRHHPPAQQRMDRGSVRNRRLPRQQATRCRDRHWQTIAEHLEDGDLTCMPGRCMRIACDPHDRPPELDHQIRGTGVEDDRLGRAVAGIEMATERLQGLDRQFRHRLA